MAIWVKQSTAVDLPIGPFVDATDGSTAETALTLTQPDIRLKKNGGAWAQKNAAQTLSHEENGWYEVSLDTTDTNTLGVLNLAVHESGALPVWLDLLVVPANVWDSFFGADRLQVHADEITAGLITATAIATDAIDADAIAANAIDAGAIATGAITAAKFAADAITSTVVADNTITAAKIATDAITSAKIAADAIGAAEIANGAIDAATFAAGAIDAAAIADGAIDAATFAAGAITAAAIAADAIGASELAADAVSEIRALASGTSDSGTTTTLVDAARTEADTDYWKGCILVMTSGNLLGQARLITGFTPGTDTITVDRAFTQAVATQTYEIWPNGPSLLAETTHTNAVIPSVTTVTGNVNGSVGSVTGNVGGNVTGSVGSVATGGIAAASFAAGAIDAAAIATDAIGSAELAASAVTEIQSGLATAAALATVQADTDDIQTRLPAALVSGRIDASVGAMAANTLTATAIATDAITAAKIAADAIGASELAADAVTEIQSGLATAAALATVDDFLDTEIAAIITTLGTPAGASISADIAAIEAQTDDIGVAGAGLTAIPWNAAWDAEVQSEATDALNAYDPPTHAELVSEVNDVQSDIAALNDLSATQVEDAVWDALLADHQDAGSTGEALGDASAAGDPWNTALPGAYGAGTAGNIVGNNLNATVSSRATQTSVNTIDDFLDTEIAGIITTLGTPAGASISADIAAIEAQTDDIGAAGAGLTAVPWNPAWDAEVQSEVDDALVVHRLDELLNADSDIDGAAPPTVGSVFHELLTKTAGSFTYDQTTDSLEALRDNLATAAALDAVDNFVDTEIAAIITTLGTPAGASLAADIAAIEAQTDDIGTAGAGLTAVPWNAAWDAEVQSEVADALGVYDPPTHAELVSEINAVQSDIAALNDLSATEVENAVWDAVMADHLDAGSTGASLNGAGSAGDPWTTALPGAYGAGTAGNIVGTNLNATVSSRASQASVDTIDNFVDTEIAAIQTTLGSPAGASLAADIAAIEAQTDDIGTAGAGLTAVPWNAAWDAEVQSEVADALGVYDPPTHAELTAGLAAADDATLAAIAALNDLTAVEVENAVWDAVLASHLDAGSTGEALDDAGGGGGGGASAADIWSYANRTLTMTVNQILSAVAAGDRITVQRGDTLSWPLTDLGSVSGNTRLWFTVKRNRADLDTAAILQIELPGGLIRLNGAAGTAGDGSITVVDAPTGDVTIVIASVASAQLPPGKWYWDFQSLIGTTVHTHADGVFEVDSDITRDIT